MIAGRNTDVSRAWRTFQEASPVRIGSPRSAAEYLALMDLMNDLLIEIGEETEHKDMALLDLIGVLVERYESKDVRIPGTAPVATLAYLMEDHGLKPSDLTPELGSESTAGEILRGTRKITDRQAKALGVRFAISPTAFI